jgi:hypothetical protein
MRSITDSIQPAAPAKRSSIQRVFFFETKEFENRETTIDYFNARATGWLCQALD